MPDALGNARGPRRPRAGYPHMAPVMRRLPAEAGYPAFSGFPSGRCYYIDGFGRCCDSFGRCCERWGRDGGCGEFPPTGRCDRWYGLPGSWDVMPDLTDRDVDGD